MSEENTAVQQRTRAINHKLHRVSRFSTLDRFLASPSVAPGVTTICDGVVPIDFLTVPANSDTTVFFFHGAIEPHFTLPVLSGLGVSGGLNANRVFVSDPSLFIDNQLLLSWYAGNFFQPTLQTTFIQIFQKILHSLGSKRTIFFGGSGGGFASLYFAHYFDNSLALAFNPQTNIQKYQSSAVRTLAERAFLVEKERRNPLELIPESVTTNLCDLYSSSSATKVAYMQNINDSEHVKNHLQPFIDVINPEIELLLLAEPWRKGHTPPPKDLLTKVLNLSSTSCNWTGSLQEAGFVRPNQVMGLL